MGILDIIPAAFDKREEYDVGAISSLDLNAPQATLSDYQPTMAQDLVNWLHYTDEGDQRSLFKFFGVDPYEGRKILENIVGNPNNSQNYGMGLLDILGVGAPLRGQEAWRVAQAGADSDNTLQRASGAAGMALSAAEAIPFVGGALRIGNRGARGLLNTAKRVEVNPDNLQLKPETPPLLVAGRGIGDNGGPALSSLSPAQEISNLLASGRADQVTDEMLGKLTPNDNMELFDLYQSGATGMDLPMDEASRMARAAERSMVPGYHGTIPNRVDDIYRSIDEFPANPDIKEFDINRSTRGQSGKGLYFAPPHNIELANKFAQVQSANPAKIKSLDPNNPEIKGVVYPTMVRANNQANFQEMRKAQYDYENAQKELGKSVSYAGLSDAVLETLKPQGFSGVDAKHEFTTFYPENVRSKFARFDPRLSNLKNLSAAIASVPGGLLVLQEMQKRANEEQYKQGLLQ